MTARERSRCEKPAEFEQDKNHEFVFFWDKFVWKITDKNLAIFKSVTHFSNMFEPFGLLLSLCNSSPLISEYAIRLWLFEIYFLKGIFMAKKLAVHCVFWMEVWAQNYHPNAAGVFSPSIDTLAVIWIRGVWLPCNLDTSFQKGLNFVLQCIFSPWGKSLQWHYCRSLADADSWRW